MSERLANISSAFATKRLTESRQQSKLCQKELYAAIYPQRVSQYLPAMFELIRTNADIFQHPDIEEMDRPRTREIGTRQALKILTTLDIDLEKQPYKLVAAMYGFAFFNMGTTIKTLLHYLLYVKSLLTFQSNDYHRECILNKGLQDIGSFSLTEMHHGSFSRGIATLATYDHSSRSFTLSTQGEKGMKFWIGALSQTATKTILWAQLIVDGVSHGPHPFVLQVRDPKTHHVLPGIVIGDCGPKNGLNLIDNGYMMIEDHRIPAKCLLGGLGSINSQGKYESTVKKSEQRFGLHMSPLSTGRAIISFGCLAQAVACITIALRYASERRQFKPSPESPETLLIDYPSVKYRLMPLLAATIVYHFGSSRITELYIENAKNFTDPSKKIVSQLHAASAVLKAKSSWLANSVSSDCRELLGGHGYSAFSRLGVFYHETDIHTTWEGDNNMLLQQTSKFLFRAIKLKEQTAVYDLSFVSQGMQKFEITDEALNNLSNLRILLEGVFLFRYNAAAKEMQRLRQEAESTNKAAQEAQVWNRLQPYFANEMALTYGDLLHFDSCLKVISSLKGSEAIKDFLANCLRLWAQGVLLKSSIEDVGCRKILQNLIVEGCEKLAPDAVVVTDALCAPSFVVGSPFANEQGDGMKEYINLLFAGRNTFRRVPWFNKIVTARQ